MQLGQRGSTNSEHIAMALLYSEIRKPICFEFHVLAINPWKSDMTRWASC